MARGSHRSRSKVASRSNLRACGRVIESLSVVSSVTSTRFCFVRAAIHERSFVQQRGWDWNTLSFKSKTVLKEVIEWTMERVLFGVEWNAKRKSQICCVGFGAIRLE